MTDAPTLAALAARWSELLLADLLPDEVPTRAARESGSLLRPPASEQDVEAAERRLGRALPPSYREFLLLSDGAYGDLSGASRVWTDDLEERASSESSVVGVGLLPVADVRWLREARPAIAQIYAETDEGEPPAPATVDGQEVWPWAPFADGLVVGVDHAPGTLCLVPFDGDPEWQVWYIAKETSRAFLSFRSFLAHEVAVREPVTTVDEAREVVAAARAGDPVAAARIGRTTAPDAVPLLLPLLEERRWAFHAADGLGRIGTPEAVAALERVDGPVAARALVLAGTPEARDQLARRGAVAQLARLGDPRAVEIAADVLARRPLPEPCFVRYDPIAVLARYGDERHVDVLLPLLGSDEWTAFHAAWALSRLGSPHGRQALERIAVADGPMASSARAHLRLREGRAAGGTTP